MLCVENIHKSYTPNVPNSNVLDDISFKIEKGEIFSILGKNGAGKSTLIKIMTTLLKTDRGRISFNDKCIESNLNRYKERIGVVFERSDNLYDYLNITDNLLYFGGLMGMSSKMILKRAEHLMKKFDLFEHRNKLLAQFSQGMRQKSSIIMAMINKPEILFLDEPTLGLDIISKRKIIKEIRSLAREEKISVVLTSHQLDVVEQVADRVMILSNHKIAFMGPVMKLKQKHSQNKYVIKIKKENYTVDDLKFTFASNVSENHECFVLDILETEKFNLNSLLSDLMKKSFTIESFSRELNSLEDIMIEYLEDKNA